MKLPFQLGRYTLLEMIGAGAFGRVYKAEVHGDMGFVSEFAVKVLDANVVASNPNVAAQMGDEARILAQLDHPNIVKVIDFLHEDHDILGDVYYMVLEFVRGVDVGDMIEQLLVEGEPIPATAALHMGLMVADALDHAHTLMGRDGLPLGIVHRDLKPQNLMVNFRGQVKILDFGIAKARDDRLAARTQEGQTKGTVFYMSPEQLTGDELDGRADLFSLGAILFELLMGRRLLDVEVATPADLARAMHTAFEMDIDSRLVDLRQHLEEGHNGELPDEAVDGWIALLRSALQKDVQLRPVSARVMSEQLEWLRARHPQSEHRNFWSKQASMGLERNSGPFNLPLEEVPEVEEEPNSFAEAADFFGMDSSTVVDGQVAADSRPEITPPEVPVTRAMSVVEGTVRSFGSTALRSVTVPPDSKPPLLTSLPTDASEDEGDQAAGITQTLDPDVEPTMAFGDGTAGEQTVPFNRDPSMAATDQVRSLPRMEKAAKSESRRKLLLGSLATLGVFAVLLLVSLSVFFSDSEDGTQKTTQSQATETNTTAASSSTATVPPTDKSPTESEATSATPDEAAPAEVVVDIPRALDPNPQKTAAERDAAEQRARERERETKERNARRAERSGRSTERASSSHSGWATMRRTAHATRDLSITPLARSALCTSYNSRSCS